MNKMMQRIGWLVVALVVGWLWWSKEFSSHQNNAPPDPVRLSLRQATLYQYDEQGKQGSYLRSDLIERLKNGETDYISLQLWQKIPTGDRMITAKRGKQRGAEILLEQDVIAQEQVAEKPSLILKTERLTYDQQKNIAFSDVGASLSTPNGQNYADAVKWQIDEKLFILKKNIRSVYVPTP